MISLLSASCCHEQQGVVFFSKARPTRNGAEHDAFEKEVHTTYAKRTEH